MQNTYFNLSTYLNLSYLCLQSGRHIISQLICDSDQLILMVYGSMEYKTFKAYQEVNLKQCQKANPKV